MSTNTRHVHHHSGSGTGCVLYPVGVGLAGLSSYLLGNPIGWVVVHACCGWLYMLYLCLGCGGGLPYSDLWSTPAKDVVEDARGGE